MYFGTTARPALLRQVPGPELGEVGVAGREGHAEPALRDDAPLALGSIKANLGHSEPAAGMTGLIHLAQRLQSGDTGAPNAQLRILNPHVGGALRGMTAACALCVQPGARPGARQPHATPRAEALLQPLSHTTAPDAGGVSSFGYSGTIAHAAFRQKNMRCATLGCRLRLLYRRQCFPWRSTACRADTARTSMYSACWSAAALAPVSPRRMHVLMATQGVLLRNDDASLRWQTVAVLLEASGSSAPLVHGTQLALVLAQQLAAGVIKPAPRMLMLTCGALAVGGAAVSDAAHGGVWGFARVLRLEHAALAAQIADISCVASAVASLTMLAPTVEGEAACSASSRFVSRLRACTAASSATMALAMMGSRKRAPGCRRRSMRAMMASPPRIQK